MRRTYRDGTRTLFPAQTVWPLCRTFFCSRASSPEKSAAARAPACAPFTGNKTTPSLPQRGKRPVLRTFVPALLKLLSTRADVPPVQPPKPPCCLLLSAALCPGAPQRGNTRHHRETGSGTGCQDGAYAASDKFPARGLCPAHTVSSKGERRGRITLRQQVLQTVRLPDYWFDNWFDNQASASTLRRTSAPAFSCSSAKRPEGMASSTASPICASVPVPSSFSWWSPCVLFVQVFRTVSGNCPETDRAWTRTGLLFLLEPAR